MYQPRILTIQDISCFGKCSLTVALPIISAMGVETVILPTAILSTHTGGFSGFTFRDLTDDVEPITAHWKKENIGFDGIYTGYLGSARQLELVGKIFDENPDAFRLVDPVMADNGKLYTGFTEEFAAGMAKLCAKADIIVPNLTEACFMLKKPYPASYDLDYVKDTLKELCGMGCKTAIITGVLSADGKQQGAVAYDSKKDEFTSYYSENLDAKYHGTGDIFSSALCGANVLGKPINEALRIAVEYTVACIRKSMPDKEHKYGVRFEECIPTLVDLIK